MPLIIMVMFLFTVPLYGFEGILPAPMSVAAYTAASEGYASVYENPAGLANTGSGSVTVSQARKKYDTYAYDAGIEFPLRSSKEAGSLVNFTYAAGFYQEIRRDLAIVRVLLNPDGTPMIDPISGGIMEETAGFADKVYSRFNLGASASAGPLNMGVSVSGIEAQHDVISGWGFSASAGVIYGPFPGLLFGIAVKDIGRTTISWADERPDYDPMKAAAGTAFTLLDRMTLIADAVCAFDHGVVFDWRVGAEIKVFEQLMLRAGFAGNSPRIGFEFSFERFSIDCAYLINTDFYDAARLSATLEF